MICSEVPIPNLKALGKAFLMAEGRLMTSKMFRNSLLSRLYFDSILKVGIFGEAVSSPRGFVPGERVLGPATLGIALEVRMHVD
jgi:hypothetical protein